MKNENNKNVLEELQTVQEDIENSKSNSSALVRRTETALVKSGISAREARELILPSRRQFLTTASTATAGLLITPLDGWASFKSGVALAPKDVFIEFGNAIAYKVFNNLLPTAFPVFSNLLNLAIRAIRQIFGFKNSNYLTKWFGNVDSKDSTGKLIGAILNEGGYNLALPWLINSKNTTIVKVYQTVMSIADKAKKILGNLDNRQGVSHYFPRPIYFLNAKNEAMEEKLELAYQTNINQSYFQPKLEGDYGKIAEGTHTTARILTKNFDTPVFAETETGALIMTDYTKVSFKNDKGDGKIEFFVVPPNRRKELDNYIKNKYSNFKVTFFDSEMARKELKRLMKKLTITSDVTTYYFEGEN